MDAIFHEKQEGSLCAQHCLNALLQGPYFSAVDLADIARQLDETEREHMAAGGLESEGYKEFLKQPSNNYDDSGFFSVQVIAQALAVMDLELLPYNSQNPVSKQAKADPTQMQAYICNFGEHWLTVRKMGNQWFNLNSLLTGPELISDTYLSMFLHQLQQDGYSIFIIFGNLAPCEADPLLRLCPAVQPIKPQLISDGQHGARSGHGSGGQGSGAQGSGGQRLGGPIQEEGGEGDEEIQRALMESKKLVERDDLSLQRALQMSMEGYLEESVTRIDTACVGGLDSNAGENGTGQTVASDSRTQGQILGGATSASIGGVTGKSHDQSSSQSVPSDKGHKLGSTSETPKSENGSKESPDMDDMRQKRLAFLNRLQNDSNTNNAAENRDNPCTDSECGKTSANEKSEGVLNEQETTNQEVTENTGELSEEEMLQRAIAMSMDSAT